MRRLGVGAWVIALGSVGFGLGAAPAAPSYYVIERTIARVEGDWGRAGASAQPNAAGWNAFFAALRRELHGYSLAQDGDAQLVALNRIYQMSVALSGVAWNPARELREELRAWLRPRVRLAWAERRLIEQVHTLTGTADANVRNNRQRWVEFVASDLGTALRGYDGAATVAGRLEGLSRVYRALEALQAGNRARPWVPSVALQDALNDLCNLPNLDVSADAATLTPVFSNNVVESGPIYRKGYVTTVTAGPKTGFGLMFSNEGIAFYNRQLASTYTPITDFQQQMLSDPKGKRAAKLYAFSAASYDQSEQTIVAVLTPNGLRLSPQSQHSVDAAISSAKQPGKGLGRFIASAIGLNQQKITAKVYEGAVDKIRQNVVDEAHALANERSAKAAVEKNAQLARHLLFGYDALAIENLLIGGLTLRSRPENALIGGKLQWRGAPEQIGADAPQPPEFAVPAPGVSADVHLGSILTCLSRGYLESEAVRALENLMVVTRKIPPGAPPNEGIVLSRNVDYATYLKAVEVARAANDPKVLAIRVKRPGHSPEFAADANGYLVALVHDFLIEVPAPAAAARGGLAGPPAQVYRITSPRAEFVISFRVSPNTQTTPVRLSGRIESFDPGPEARVLAVDRDETRAAPLTAFTRTFVLNVFKTKLRGQPVDVPLSNLQLRGFAIREVSALDPSGWIRVNLVRTSASPAAGIQ